MGPGPAGGGGRPASHSGTLTLLFTDIEESTALAAQVGDLAYSELLGRHYADLRKAVADHHGTEVKDRGDGLMVVFGSARAALCCARDMQRAAAVGELGLKIGINSGELAESGGDYHGHAANVAARLSDAAVGGEVLVSSLTWGLARSAGDLRFSPPRVIALKGIPDPEEVRALLWDVEADIGGEVADRRRVELPLPSLVEESTRLPFVGRRAALGVLDRAWADARGGERRLVLVGGEPGIGKTRLASELAQRAHADGSLVLAGRCDEELGLAYQPFVDGLRHCAAHLQGGTLRRTLGRRPAGPAGR